jgi:predicted AAA+ superfamily ATPase
MERLKRLSIEATRRVPTEFQRFLLQQIDRDMQMTGIVGARGSGKTILLLQMMKSLPDKNNAMYVSLDDIYFTENKLVYFAEEFHSLGGKYLFIDEVHKYPGWSQELKNIYDNLPGLKVVFTASSALDIYKGSYDLSRRVMMYHLPGLSFREFLTLKYKIKLPALTLEDILSSNDDLYIEINEKIKPLPLFDEYLKTGYFPFFINAGKNYSKLLLNTVNLIIENDLPSIYNLDYNSSLKLKRLLVVISKLVPFKPNIEKLAKQIGISRDTLLRYLFYLDKAHLLNRLFKNTSGISILNKPEKIYLSNTNLAYSLSDNTPDIGNIRETFFLNQLLVSHTLTYPAKGDFVVDGKYHFEIGGKNKTSKQIAGIEDAFVAADGIEYRFGNKIPLWVFGLMY